MSVTLFLGACGGGGDSKNNDVKETATPNTAPTLSGIFSLTASATTKASLVINANDAEGDGLSVSIKDIPHWLTTSFENNQVSVFVEPGFLDIGEYTFQLTVSDANLSTEYDLHVTVEDNPSAYDYPALSYDDIPSYWLLESGDSFHFYPDGKGVFRESNGNIYGTDWSVTFGRVKVELIDPVDETIYLEGLVKEGSQYRLLIEREQKADIRTNTKAFTVATLADGVFGLPHSLSTGTLQIDSASSSIRGRINGDLTGALAFSGKYNEDMSITVDQPKVELGRYRPPFYNTKTETIDNIELIRELTSLAVEFYDGQFLVLKSEFKYVLTENNSSITVTDYNNLESFLNDRDTAYFESVKLNKTEFPIIKAGDTLVSQFNAPISIDGIEHTGSANQLVLDSAESGRLITEISAPKENHIESAIQWSMTNDTLTITSVNETRQYSLYKTHLGDTVLLGFGSNTEHLENSFEAISYSPLIKAENSGMTADTFIGNYIEGTFGDFRDTRPQLISVLENNRMDYFYSNDDFISATDFWKQNVDGSFLILSNRSSQCTSASSYDECLSIRMSERENGDQASITVRKVTPMKIDGNKYYFKYEYLYDAETFATPRVYANSTIRLWLKRDTE